ncbi:MAG TPA: hypothetical protein VFQ39_00140 [Longimicrobium sp.]|nr:hypothetical protein [Longimicrobium sp.]
MLTLLLALAAAGPDTAAAPRAPAQDGPAVVVHRQPALPVAALRLSLLADDPAGYAGAGHLFQHLLLAAMEEQAGRVGARVQAVRTSDAVVYSIVGPAEELDYMAGVLRSALRAPQSPSSTDLLSALRHLAEERAAERETAPTYVRAALRAALFPGDLPAAGTDEAASRLETADLAALWARMYAPDRVSIVAIGDVRADAVRRAFRSLPSGGRGEDGEAGVDTVPSLAADTPQATRAWVGRAYLAPDADPAAVSVTARLLRSNLRRRMTRSAVEVEHWWTHHGQALALVVATPDSLLPAARRTVTGALEAAGADVTPASVADAARAVRREMLFYSRTPERMAEIVGGFADRGDDSEAAQRYYARLEEVTEDDVRAVLALLAAQEPAAVEVPAQRIPREGRR